MAFALYRAFGGRNSLRRAASVEIDDRDVQRGGKCARRDKSTDHSKRILFKAFLVNHLLSSRTKY